MPLPVSDMAWPPAELEEIEARQALWDAWYVGDRKRLENAYGGNLTAGAPDRASQFRGGIVGVLARMFWGKPASSAAEAASPSVKLHVPIARDLCRAAAYICWADPPQIKRAPVTAIDAATGDPLEADLANDPVAQQLGQYMRDGLIPTLRAGYEIAASLAGMYPRVTRSTVLPGRSFVTVVDADAAWPRFEHDRLIGVTFWWVLSRRNNEYVRHLEDHALDADGNGTVQHSVYLGTKDRLGRPQPLANYSATAGLTVDADGYVPDSIMPRTPGLCVRFIPVLRPAAILRGDPIGHALGRSIHESLEPLYDQLDSTFTQLFRDIDLAKGRLVVPEGMLQNLGKGMGQSFNIDQQIYTPGPNALGEGAVQAMTVAQFQANVSDKMTACQEITERIIAAAGFSTQTFGENEEGGGGVTATEVNQRVTMSAMTRDGMLDLARPELHALLLKMLATDGVVPASEDDVVVQFPEAAQASPLILAQTAAAMRTALGASTRTVVETLHPDWTDAQVAREVKAIADEAAKAAESSQFTADPASFGAGGNGLGTPVVPGAPVAAPAA